MEFISANIISCAIGAAVLLGIIILLFLSLFTVEQNTVVIVEEWGKFAWIARPGLNWCVPFMHLTCDPISLRLQELNVTVETKTKDNVFVEVLVAVQYRVLPDKVQDAFYKLTDEEKQIESYVFDAVRSMVPKMELDSLFENKDKIADDVREQLSETMDDYGFEIVKALVNGIEPDEKVKDSMNEINAARRLREAASEKGEAERILAVKRAEAEAESKRLQGEGIANQRKAIAEGLKKSAKDLADAGVKSEDVMSILLMTQYLDTLREIGAHAKTNTILIPHSPGGMGSFMTEMQKAVLTAREPAAE